MDKIQKSVGRGCINILGDVKLIQQMLNNAICSLQLDESGNLNQNTIAAIDYFQKFYLGIKPDGRISPSGPTFTALELKYQNSNCKVFSIALPASSNGVKLTNSDFDKAAKKLGCEEACIRAVTDVESKGGGFFSSGKPKILFEAHIFSKKTFHAFDKRYPDISSSKWNKALYLGGEAEYSRLEKAMTINRQAALESTSWGLFQIMGFNYSASGFSSIEDYTQAMFESEGKQLLAFVNFISKVGLTKYLKSKDWKSFARAYNGPKYQENKYDTKLEIAYKKYDNKKIAVLK
ncbi:N-acetylmuramidase family protein [Methylobacter sp. BBA5.1]|uniref:N-acetylmuramidase family protein n=1 Tax=Methylobacter sp. BBA5.1 TaxID=1495064 RepID=UPI000564A112|nr:N-acetylmuramidase family protein [Methylobacter sp. BBA5.1]